MSGHITKLSDTLERKTVTYPNRYGFTVTGELYYAKDINKNVKHPALIVGAPYGGVKEQGPCVYGDELAQRGFVVLTFDQSFMGESSGFPLSAAQCDVRIKAVATLSMYDMNVASRLGMDEKAVRAAKEQMARQRWVDAENGYPEYVPFFPEQPMDAVPVELEEPNAEWFRFYALKRGHHPNARGGFTTTSNLAMMNFPLLDYIKEISPRPILFVMGDRAHSRFFSENAYAAANEPKELYTVADAEHIDLYDRVDRIPFDKLEDFFLKNLNQV